MQLRGMAGLTALAKAAMPEGLPREPGKKETKEAKE